MRHLLRFLTGGLLLAVFFLLCVLPATFGHMDRYLALGQSEALERTAQIWSLASQHVPESSLVVSLCSFVLSLFVILRGQAQRRRDMQEEKKNEDAKARVEEAQLEQERSRKFIVALSEIEQAKDPHVLKKAVEFARSLAREPKPVRYEQLWRGLLDSDHRKNQLPVIDEGEELFIVELLYHSNPVAPIPSSVFSHSTPYEMPEGFSSGIPKEWLPRLFNAIISTLPARFPSYYHFAEDSHYNGKGPVEAIRRISTLAQQSDQPRLGVELGALAEFVANSYAEHWSKLPSMIQRLVKGDGKHDSKLAAAFLNVSRRSGALKAYWPNMVQLAILLGVSESILWIENRLGDTSKEQLLKAYASIFENAPLEGLWHHRYWNNGIYCHQDSDSLVEIDGEDVAIEWFEIAKDHSGGNLSVDAVIAMTVYALGAVVPDSTKEQSDQQVKLTQHIVLGLTGVFSRYKHVRDFKSLLKGTSRELMGNGEVELAYQHVGIFVEGIHKLAQSHLHKSDREEFVKAAGILVPALSEKLRELDHDER